MVENHQKMSHMNFSRQILFASPIFQIFEFSRQKFKSNETEKLLKNETFLLIFKHFVKGFRMGMG